MGFVLDQIPNALQHEFLGIETHCVTGTARPIGKLVQQGQGGIFGEEDVEPPSTRRVTLQTVQKAVMTMLHQSLAKSVAASVCSPTVSLPRPYRCPPISGWLVAALRSRNMEGAEVAQQSVGKDGEVGHRAGI